MKLEHNRRRRLITIGVVAFILFLIQYSGLLPELNHASPFNLLLPIVIFAGMYLGEWGGAVCGLIIGIFADAVSADVTCFNTVIYMIIGCVSGLFITYLFNNTAVAATFLSLIFSFLFETARFIMYYTMTGFETAAYHYTKYSLVSALFTFLLSIPMYFVFKKLMKFSNR